MRKKAFLFLYSIFVFNFSEAQLREDFRDSNFSENPGWTGDTSDFIVNNLYQLQSNKLVEGSQFYLVTASTMTTNAEWEFWLKLSFNPSSANYVDAYLTASQANLLSASTYGYFIRIGNTDDEISLHRKDKNGSVVKIIDGENGLLNHSANVLKIKVIRNQLNEWQLFRDVSGSGNQYISEGKIIDSTYSQSSHFGFLVKQSTSFFFQKHFFDDIVIKPFIPDTIPPKIISATTISNNRIELLFDEPVEKTSALIFSNYQVNGLGMPSQLLSDSSNSCVVTLSFDKTFDNGVAYTLNVNGVKDLSGNEIKNANAIFVFYSPKRCDVIIDEIFPDPSPQVGLPLYKFIELKNTSSFPVNLKNWKLSDGNSTSTLPSYHLNPDSFVIVCATNPVIAFSSYGPVIGVSNFPSMNISGSNIILKNEKDETIHAIKYDLTTYKNELKKSGGWSIEMIDTKNPCSGQINWKASINPNGGTPGKRNSIDGMINDETTPKLLRAFVVNENVISLIFDKTLDSLSAVSSANYSFNKNVQVKNISVKQPFFNEVYITSEMPFVENIIYQVIAKNISDCAGNSVSDGNTAKFGIPQEADSMDIVINEILFNPLPYGSDYVELYNRSNKIIDLKKIFIANRNSRKEISSIEPLTSETILLFPGDYLLVSQDAEAVKAQYLSTNTDCFLQTTSFPSFPNADGTVIVLNNQGKILDEINYSEKWHFSLIKNVQGVSLERVDFNAPSVQINFHSAATSVGYGTPGYKNSQYQLANDFRTGITVMPEIFSPDNDGIDDFATISYIFPTPGFVANISIFDASGRSVRYLQKNALCGLKGSFRWDGLDEKNKKLAQGIYVIYTEIFNTEGRKKVFKNTLVLGRRH